MKRKKNQQEMNICSSVEQKPEARETALGSVDKDGMSARSRWLRME